MNNLQTALENVVEKEAASYDQGEEHSFSPKFEKEMSRLIKNTGRKSPLKKGKYGIIALAAAVAVLTLAAGTMAKSTGFSIGSYKFENDRTRFRTFSYEDTGSSPKTIETVYTLSGLGSEYKYALRYLGDSSLSTYYSRSEEAIMDNMFLYKNLSLYQSTKETFSTKFIDTKYSHFENFSYKDKTAYYAYYECPYGRDSVFIWEDGDYCFEIDGNLTKEEATKLADSLKPYQKEIINGERVEEML